MIEGKQICPAMSRPTVVELCPEPEDKQFAKEEGFVIIDDTAYEGIIFCPHSDDCEFWKELRLVSGATKWQCAYTHTSVSG